MGRLVYEARDQAGDGIAAEPHIGQIHEASVFNLCAAGTMEARVLSILDDYIRIFKLVVGEIGGTLGNLDGGAEVRLPELAGGGVWERRPLACPAPTLEVAARLAQRTTRERAKSFFDRMDERRNYRESLL